MTPDGRGLIGKGKPSNQIFGKFLDFVPTEGGGSANPKFLSNFSRTNFTMVNGQKCDETVHNWGPPIRHPNQKNEFFS